MERAVRVLFVLTLAGVLLGGIGSSAHAQEQDGVNGSTYTSPVYGYSVSWDDQTWSVTETFSEGGYDLLHLVSESVDIYVEGDTGFASDLDECIGASIDFYANEDGVSSVEPIDGSEFAEDGFAGVSVAIAAEDDQGAYELTAIFVCVAVEEGAFATLTAIGAPDDVADAEAAIGEVFDSFELGENSPQNAPAGENLESFMTSATRDINSFWDGQFEAWDQTYENPKFITFIDETVETGCGDAAPGENGPFYCPEDLTVYMDMVGIDEEVQKYGRVILSVTIAHEIGHHVQALLGLEGCGADGCGNYGGSLAIELQADCFAGAWIASADSRELLNGDDVEKAVIAISDYFGDPPGTSPDDPDAHGPGKLRTFWFLKGYYEGADTCLAEQDAQA